MTPLNHFSTSVTLIKLQKHMASIHLRALFSEDKQRFEKYTLEAAGLFLDFSKNHINDEVMSSLFKMAKAAKLPAAIRAMFHGEKINYVEKRAVLHTALRNFGTDSMIIDGKDIMPIIRNTHRRMKEITEAVHSGQWKGFTGKSIKHVVNIGIGGSYLGLKTVINALTPYHRAGFKHHYIVNIDPNVITETFKKIDPETTLFIIASKSFSTLETMQNAQAVRAWILENGCSKSKLSKHFIAISTNLKAVNNFGIAQENRLPLWDWVGGRYSLWSAIGLIISLVVGFDHFQALLKGAWKMDKHFTEAPLEKCMPVILGMLGIWYQNYFGSTSHAVITYEYFLRNFSAYLQQIDMESNGKCTRQDGSMVDYQTGPIIWGGVGTNDQHTYYQLLHQGTHIIPVDFIVSATSHNPFGEQHTWLFANALAQSQAMMQGKTLEEVYDELTATGIHSSHIEALAPHKVIPGNRPNNIIILKKITPAALGALVALYEHKVFVQGTLWQINSFDQCSVDFGKVLSNRVYNRLTEKGQTTDQDSSTNGLINRFKQFNNS